MITMKHRGHEITFSESDERWSCGDLGLSDASLAKLKVAIDRAAKQMRTVRVPALLVNGGYWRGASSMREVMITLLFENGRKARVEYLKPHKGGDKKGQEDVANLYPVSARDEVIEYLKKDGAALKALEVKEAAWSKLTDSQLTAERIRELVVQQADAEGAKK